MNPTPNPANPTNPRTDKYRYLHLDVFTDRLLEGNQLAVFPAPAGLDAETMQLVAREMAFSETTFIFPAERGGDVRMRIFTPGAELPMAGHPTIGSTFALAAEGTIPPGGAEFVFELGVGPTPVSLDWAGGSLRFAWMTQLLPQFGGTVADRAALAAALGVARDDLQDNAPAQMVSCGVPFLFVPLASRAAVDSVSVERRALARCCRDAGLEELGVFVFTTERGGTSGPEHVYSRMMAPGLGVAEDPATGSASGPLGCYMLRHGIVDAATARSLVSLQGVAMRRPSRIHISIESAGRDITRVRVGGQAVIVGRGEIALPSA
jgi:trans-2,3-dihydro-3-hydroxyanthranilate isomerase